jgi:micrococcal nuclease
MLDSLVKSLETILVSLIILINSYGITVQEIPENKVIKVIDGDTIEVYENKKIERVRMIGLNTPETVDPRKPVECFGVEASTKLKDLLSNQIVRLESDETQTNLDKYGRQLRYVYLNNENINQKMIEEGYGFEYTYKTPYKYQKEFKESQKRAQQKSSGLWNKSNCNY